MGPPYGPIALGPYGNKTQYPGLAQLVARLLWEREALVRATVLGKPGKPWDT